MKNESNLVGRPEIAGPHSGRIGELYDQMSSQRIREIKPAIANWIRVLEKQGTTTNTHQQPVFRWATPQSRPVVEQASPQKEAPVEQDISVDSARQAIDEAVMEIEEGEND